MGLLNGTIPATSLVDDVIVYNGNTYNSGATGEKWTRIDAECTTISWNASTTFTSSTNKPFNDTTNGILYYVAKPSDATIAISATAGSHLYAWSVSGSNTTVNTANTYKSFTIVTPDYSNDFNQKIWKFSYSGTSKQWVAPHLGDYTLTVYGAQGGSVNATYKGGLGAMVSGKLTLAVNTSLYVYVGQQGKTDGTNAWNGGGHMHIPYHSDNNKWIKAGSVSCGGGGGTDIALRAASVNAWKEDAHLYSRIIIAGGGGGAYYWTGEKDGSTNSIASGGNGFGNSSNQWYGCNGAGVSDPGKGGTLNAAGANPTYYQSSYESASFGYGGSMDFYHTDSWQYEAAGAGGGGWYGGGFGGFGTYNGSGGGGSSYAWTSTLSSYYPNSSYKPSTSYYLSNVTLSSSGNTGNGYAQISFTNP